MDWIYKYQLFLFDFDGLLVNTEHLHFEAYKQMLAARGCFIDWDFSQFCQLAHLNSEALKRAIYQKFPNLDPSWSVLYEEKKQIYYSLISRGSISLMPGVEAMLLQLQSKKIPACVVTNSLHEQIALIRLQIPALQTIEHWITREDYEKPKPDPECYLKAIQLYGKKGDRIIGFEDSIRGLTALMQTPAQAVLVCSKDHPLLDSALPANVLHFSSMDEVIA